MVVALTVCAKSIPSPARRLWVSRGNSGAGRFADALTSEWQLGNEVAQRVGWAACNFGHALRGALAGGAIEMMGPLKRELFRLGTHIPGHRAYVPAARSVAGRAAHFLGTEWVLVNDLGRALGIDPTLLRSSLEPAVRRGPLERQVVKHRAYYRRCDTLTQSRETK